MLVRLSLPMDAIEGYVWGQHFQWGYDRNPWLNALLTHWAVIIGGKSGWLVYGFSQIFVCLGYLSVWKLARKIIGSESQALISVLMLIGIQYTSIAAVDFNDNVIELGLWPLLTYFCYQAYFSPKSSQQFIYWGLTGIAAGLALMTKYYSIMPLLALGLFFLFTSETHKIFKTSGPYFAGILCFLICLPHLLWLPKHGFITMTYALDKAHRIADPDWVKQHQWLFFFWNHTYYAIYFAIAQICTFGGCLILLAFGIFPRSKTQISFPKISKLSLRFLNFAAMGPFLLSLITSIIFGWKLNTMWGTPLLSLWPLWALCYFKPRLNHDALLKISSAALIVFLLFLLGYGLHNFKNQNTRHNFNGQAYSNKITEAWLKIHHTPLTEIDGTQDRYLAGYVAFYADHPIQVKLSN